MVSVSGDLRAIVTVINGGLVTEGGHWRFSDHESNYGFFFSNVIQVIYGLWWCHNPLVMVMLLAIAE